MTMIPKLMFTTLPIIMIEIGIDIMNFFVDSISLFTRKKQSTKLDHKKFGGNVIFIMRLQEVDHFETIFFKSAFKIYSNNVLQLEDTI